jgi:hypothetical protein
MTERMPSLHTAGDVASVVIMPSQMTAYSSGGSSQSMGCK